MSLCPQHLPSGRFFCTVAVVTFSFNTSSSAFQMCPNHSVLLVLTYVGVVPYDRYEFSSFRRSNVPGSRLYTGPKVVHKTFLSSIASFFLVHTLDSNYFPRTRAIRDDSRQLPIRARNNHYYKYLGSRYIYTYTYGNTQAISACARYRYARSPS